MIPVKSKEQIEIIRESADILGRAHGEVARAVKPGISTKALDKIAEEYIKDHQGHPSFLGYSGFPASLCISVNENVVHGIPGEYVLKDGDLVSIDCGVFYKGFHSDCAYTYAVGEVSEDIMRLIRITRQSLYEGIHAAVAGNRIGDIGYAVQSFVEKEGYSVVRELVGHGVGKNLHEKPEVPNYGKRGRGAKLKPGYVLAVEPMVNLGKKGIIQESDGWTIRTADRLPSAHFEHTIAITEEGEAEILTTHQYIEDYLKEQYGETIID
ncbi:type I methionyl aminopeptidase [Marinigracilibium pacificum]|uniref:Methionine aminopeptidase n=1 Tax=Marinigracilibium pacificum TaxID=2729599 RepID=A0A848J4M6_9BACT|nr:type I methionyl aminopeptidase [Marinigracilibium pacificum]NMM49414.1 type I methionyl aminopeptidase [Marinigracilibium pacificum]